MRNYKLFGWYVWPWPATFPGISFWIINRIQKWEINHNHMKESGLNTTVNFTVFSINAENSRVVVYWGNRSFEMASNTEEFLTGNGLEGILTVIASDVLSLQRKFPKYRRTLSKKCPYSELFWSAFFRIRTEFAFFPHSKNADQNNSEYGHFSRSGIAQKSFFMKKLQKKKNTH